MATCQLCGVEYEPTAGAGVIQRWCSGACRSRAFRRRAAAAGRPVPSGWQYAQRRAAAAADLPR